MPKRTREDFLAHQRLGAVIDRLPAEATPWQVATGCASAIAEVLQAHAVVIHQHDVLRRELRSIGVHGPNAGDLLGATTNVDDDHVATAALMNKKPMMLRLDGSLPRFMPDRHRLLGTWGSLAVFPVVRADEPVFIIEVVGVAEERRQVVADACNLVAHRLAAALASVESRPRSTAPTSNRAQHRARSRESLPDDDARGLRYRRQREDRAIPATFPKRTATLVCRSITRMFSA